MEFVGLELLAGNAGYKSRLRKPDGPEASPSERAPLYELLIQLCHIAQDRQEKIQLKEEDDNSLKETQMAEMLKQEECQIQQKCEVSQGREKKPSVGHTHPSDGF